MDPAFGRQALSVESSQSSRAPQTDQRRASQRYTMDLGSTNNDVPFSGVSPSSLVRPPDHDDGDAIDPFAEEASLMKPTQCPTSYAARQFLDGASSTTIAVDAVNNLPLSIGCTQVTILFVEPRGKALLPVHELPSGSFIQTENCSCTSPAFTRAGLKANCRPKLQVAVIVTCIDHRTKFKGVLGHVVFSQFGKRGVFEMRLRAGDLNTNVTAGADDEPLYLPLTSIVVRINVLAGEPFLEGTVRLFDYSFNDELLLADRQGHTNTTLASLGLTRSQCERVFQDGAVEPLASTKPGVDAAGQPKSRPLDLSLYAPYNEKRGVAVVIHAIHFAVPADRSALQLFKVVVEVDGRLAFTQFHDWRADAFRPRFLDAFFVFDGVRLRGNAAAVIRVYRMKFHPHADVAEPADRRLEFRDVGQWTVEEYGWTMAGIQSRIGKNALRHSPTMALPLYAGRVPDELAEVLRAHESIEDAVTTMTSRGMLQNIKASVGNHRPMVTASIADPARLDEVVDERVNSDAESRNPLNEAFKRVWAYPSQVQADSNSFFRAALFSSN